MKRSKPATPPRPEFEDLRYVPEVKVAEGMGGRRVLYRLTVCRGALCYGPEFTGCWYGHNPDRLGRKGARIADRLNRELDRDQAVARARGER